MTKLGLGRSGTPATPMITSAGVSIAVHTVLIAAAVYATSGAQVEEVPVPSNSIARFLAPPNRAGGQREQREMVRYVALAVPDIIGRGGGLGERGGVDVAQPSRVAAGFDQRDAAAMPSLPGVDSVYSIVEVDSAATRYEWSAAPAFPPSMLEKRQGGYVKAQFVVDENGYADTTSLDVLEATHSEFAKAVRDALPFMRFSPAKIGRVAVRQLVQQEFTFRITTARTDTSGIRKPGP